MIDDYGPRRSGRTTRIVDQCVQEFFTKGFVICVDHYPSEKMCRYVRGLVYGRLIHEHYRYDEGRIITLRYNGKYIVALDKCVSEAKHAVNQQTWKKND